MPSKNELAKKQRIGEFKVSSGKKQRIDVVNALLTQNGRMRWIDIWNNVKELPYFSSKHELWDTLRFMEKKLNTVSKDTVNKKRVFYDLNADSSDIKKLIERAQEWEKKFAEFRGQIRASSDRLSSDVAAKEFRGLILGELARFLETLRLWVGIAPKWKDYVKWSLDRYNVRDFALMLIEMGHAHPEIMNSCIDDIVADLNKIASERPIINKSLK